MHSISKITAHTEHISHKAKKKELWLLGDLAPFVRDRERNRETREYEVRVGVQNEKMAFSFSFVMFLP